MLDERVQPRGLAQLCRGFLVTRGQDLCKGLQDYLSAIQGLWPSCVVP